MPNDDRKTCEIHEDNDRYHGHAGGGFYASLHKSAGIFEPHDSESKRQNYGSILIRFVFFTMVLASSFNIVLAIKDMSISSLLSASIIGACIIAASAIIVYGNRYLDMRSAALQLRSDIEADHRDLDRIEMRLRSRMNQQDESS